MSEAPVASKAPDVAIVSCFSEGIYQRPYMVARYFRDAGLEPVILTMDYSHVHKRRLPTKEEGFLYIPVPAYGSNISLRRIFSHIVFSLRAARQLKKLRPRFTYVCCPPNSAAYMTWRATKRYETTLIVDVLDVWPEAMPFPSKIKFLLENTIGPIWRGMRNHAMVGADYCLSESASFTAMIGRAKARCQVVYLSRDQRVIDKKAMQVPEARTLRIAYLGNINNIGDFDSLIRLCTMIESYDVFVEIIGEGEKRQYLVGELARLGIAHTYHGVIYDDAAKQDILCRCDFGFNGYKEQTVVALSYKSVEYFGKGVPLINSAAPDTWEIVEQWQAGLNYEAAKLEETARRINALDRAALWQMRLNARKVFESLFAYAPYRQKMDQILGEAMPPAPQKG